MKQSPVTILVVILALTKTSQQCRPVVLVHGLFGDEETWLNTTRYLNEECPGMRTVDTIIQTRWWPT